VRFFAPRIIGTRYRAEWMARPSSTPRPDPSGTQPDGVVARARWALLEGVGADIAAAFPGITRLGGQIVAALYLSDGPRSMDQLAAELGCSKSNIFGNLRGLEGAGIVGRRRESGARFDTYALRGPYPDVIIGAYMTRLRLVVADKRALSERAMTMLGDAEGPEAELLRERLVELDRKYSLFADVLAVLLPAMEGPIDLERLIRAAPEGLVETIAMMVRDVLAGPAIAKARGKGRTKVEGTDDRG
jgi:HTH-type transcriptional regulator, osmoprotectant uptake regulator